VAVCCNIVEDGLQVVHVEGWFAVFMEGTVRRDEYLEGTNAHETIGRNKLGKVKEQGLARNADTVGRIQGINAFSVRLPT